MAKLSMAEILEKLNEIFRDVFDDESIKISESTTAADIENWDSLTQINIILACNTEFDIKFDLKDVITLKNVGNIADLIERKLMEK